MDFLFTYLQFGTIFIYALKRPKFVEFWFFLKNIRTLNKNMLAYKPY